MPRNWRQDPSDVATRMQHAHDRCYLFFLVTAGGNFCQRESSVAVLRRQRPLRCDAVYAHLSGRSGVFWCSRRDRNPAARDAFVTSAAPVGARLGATPHETAHPFGRPGELTYDNGTLSISKRRRPRERRLNFLDVEEGPPTSPCACAAGGTHRDQAAPFRGVPLTTWLIPS
jgi:hypothetical protein